MTLEVIHIFLPPTNLFGLNYTWELAIKPNKVIFSPTHYDYLLPAVFGAKLH